MFKKIFFSFIFLFSLSFNNALAIDLDNTSGIGGGFGDKAAANIATKADIKTADKQTVPVIINSAINWALGFATTIILAIMLFAGFKMVASNGDAKSYQTGLKWLQIAVISLIIILLAYSISSFVIYNIDAATK